MFYEQDFLEEIKYLANERIEEILAYFNVDITYNDAGELRGPCRIHGGDNKSAFLYDRNHFNFRCFTAMCDTTYGPSIFGLVRALSSSVNQENLSFPQAVKWLISFLGVNQPTNAIIDQNKIELNRFLVQARQLRNFRQKKSQGSKREFKPIPLELIKDKIIPSKYFTKSFKKETILKYHLGDCHTFGRKMYNRAFVPVLSDDGKYIIGVSGRTFLDQCPVCLEYHAGKICNIDDPKVGVYPKWLHYGFSRSNTLYNLNFAAPYIKQSGAAIVVEGPKECIALYEHGIYNSVSIMGLRISKEHTKKLLNTGARSIILCLDNDGAGQKASERNIEYLQEYFTVKNVGDLLPAGVDIDELPDNKIREIF